MSSLFSIPSTPASATRSSRSRYNSDTGSTHSHSYSNIDPSLNQTPTPTHTRVHTNSVSRSQQHQQQPKTPRSSIVDHSDSPKPLCASPVHEGYSSRTPFVQHAEPPSPADHQHDRQQGTPPQMPAYHPSPSPTTTYGINGGLIVSSNPSTMATGNGQECQPLLPAQSDVFMNGKPGRSLVRSSLSSSVLTPASTNTSRRQLGVYEDNHRSAPAESGIAYASTHQQGSAHEASAPFSHSSQSVANHHHSSYPPPPPLQSSVHHSSAHTQSMPINSGPQYSDPDLSFQSASYAGSYDSSYGSHSPWTPGSAPLEHQYNQAYYTSMDRAIEPILAPGEVPAPRPPISYAALIGEALLYAPPPHQLYVSEISESIKSRYAYYRQNPTKVYNGVRHQTSMCKAFVKLPRPYGDQSGGARKWGIRAGCETQFQGGGYKPNGRPVKQSASPPPGGKAKATARAKQLAIGTNAYHAHSRSPQMSHKVKQEPAPYVPYAGGNGPSIGPAYDGSNRAPSYPSYPPQYWQPQSSASGYPPPGYHYVPIHQGHPMQGWAPHPHQQQPYQYHQGPESPDHSDTSPQITPVGSSYGPPYQSHGAYPQPGPGPYWQSAPTSADLKPYGGMPPPSSSTQHGYSQQHDDRPGSQQDHHSPASYDDASPHGNGHRDNSVESPNQ